MARQNENEARAIGRLIRVSPQKLNLLAQFIRGKPVERALSDLRFSRRRVANDVRKILESAIANAENNHDLDIDNLIVAEAYVGKNLVMKRFRARAKGRASRILKPFSQLTIIVREVSIPVSAEKRSSAQKSTPAEKAAPAKAATAPKPKVTTKSKTKKEKS